MLSRPCGEAWLAGCKVILDVSGICAVRIEVSGRLRKTSSEWQADSSQRGESVTSPNGLLPVLLTTAT